MSAEDDSGLTIAILDNNARTAPQVGNHMITGKVGAVLREAWGNRV